MSAYIRKTFDEYVIQGDYGQGWEDIAAEEYREQAREVLRDYNRNETQYVHRLTKRRIYK